MISILDTEDKPDRHSSVHALILLISHPDNNSKEEEGEMALNRGNKSLKDLMATRGKVSTSKEATKSQVPPTFPPPPPPTDLRLKPILDLKKKRPLQGLEEGEVGLQKGSKHQKVAKDPHDKRSTLVDRREEQDRAKVRLPQCTWFLQLEVDGAAIP